MKSFSGIPSVFLRGVGMCLQLKGRSMDIDRTEVSPKLKGEPTRRDFITTSSAAAAVAAAGLSSNSASAQTKNSKKLRIGAFCVGEGSFWTYSWGDILTTTGKPFNVSTLGTSALNMEVAYVWDLNPEAAQKFAAQIGAKAVSRYDEMVGLVDGVAFGGFYEIPWQYRLARPYLEAGIPTYLGRPFAYSLRDIDTILDLAAKHNTPIMATDIYEHLFGVHTLRGKLKNVGKIESVSGTCLTNDYPMRFHTLYMAAKIFGFDVQKVSLFTDDPNNSKYCVVTLLYKGSGDQPPFPCSMSMSLTGDLYSFTVSGTTGIETEHLPQLPFRNDDLLVHHMPKLLDMQRTFQGKNYEPFDIVRKKTELFLTGFYSASEKGCAPVDVGTVPIDWHARPARPDWISESMFKK
jgi:hypothetical protein